METIRQVGHFFVVLLRIYNTLITRVSFNRLFCYLFCIFLFFACSSLFESSQSLFWASFGMVGLENFELEGIKSYTRFWGLLMFGSYSVINVIVLLNLLIAMMSNSYAMIDVCTYILFLLVLLYLQLISVIALYSNEQEHSDTEWKFARTKLWMSFFEDGATLPPPFNILPSVKWITRCCRRRHPKGLTRGSTIVISFYKLFLLIS